MKKSKKEVINTDHAILAVDNNLPLEKRIPIIYQLVDSELLKKILISSNVIEAQKAALRRLIFLKLENKSVTDKDLIEAAISLAEKNYILVEILMFISNSDGLSSVEKSLGDKKIISTFCSEVISLRQRDLYFMYPFHPSKKDEDEQISVIKLLNLPSSIIEYAYISKSERVKNEAVEAFFNIETRIKDVKNLLPVNFNRDFLGAMAKNLLQTSLRGETIILANSYISNNLVTNIIDDKTENEEIKLYLLDRIPELSQSFLKNVAITSDQIKVRRKVAQMLKKKDDVFELLEKETNFLNGLLFSFMLRFKSFNA